MNTKLRVNGNKNIEHNSIKAKVGITNKKNQSVFYLEGGAFITPEDEMDNFTDIMSSVSASCRRLMKNKLLSNTAITNDFLINFEVCSDRMKKGKKSYLSFQYHFKQKNTPCLSVVTIKDENEDFFIGLLDDIENELSSYNISVSKTKKS